MNSIKSPLITNITLIRSKQHSTEKNKYNRRTRSLITRAARTGVSATSLIEVEKDTLGKRITTYNGTPLTVLGDVIDGSGNVPPGHPGAGR